MFRKVLPHSLTITAWLAVWWRRRRQRRMPIGKPFHLSRLCPAHSCPIATQRRRSFLFSIPAFFAAPRILYINLVVCSKWHFCYAIYLLLTQKFNKEKLVYLMLCAHTRETIDNLQCSYHRQRQPWRALSRVAFVSLSMLEVTLLHTKSHTNEKSKLRKMEATPKAKNKKKVNSTEKYSVFLFVLLFLYFSSP